MELTARQREIIDLRHAEDPPISWKEIARRLGSTKSSVSAIYSRAMTRLGESEPKYRKVRADAVEMQKPELVEETIDLATDPFETIRGMARKLEMPESTLHGLLERLKERYGPLVGEVKGVKTEVLRDLFSHNAHRVLRAVSDEDIEKANLKDKAIASGIYAEKSRLLKNQSTQNISIEARAHVIENIAPMIYREIQRRGLTQVVDPEDGSVRIEELRDDAIDVTPELPRVSESAEEPPGG